MNKPTIIKKLSAQTPIGGLIGHSVGDFWSWAYSDTLSNINRSIFAEFLVASALGATGNCRREWDAVDLRYRGRALEVKSAAYKQSWRQDNGPSIIRFDIEPKMGWNAEDNVTAVERERAADCYIFCLYAPAEAALTVPHDVTAWRFYVVPTPTITAKFGNQKTVGLAKIEACCQPIGFDELKEKIKSVLFIDD
jgi:hypothetical protein